MQKTDNRLKVLKSDYLDPIFESDGNVNHRNTKYIPMVKIFVFLELEKD